MNSIGEELGLNTSAASVESRTNYEALLAAMCVIGPPCISTDADALKKSKIKNTLSKFLTTRPKRQTLVEKKILKD